MHGADVAEARRFAGPRGRHAHAVAARNGAAPTEAAEERVVRVRREAHDLALALGAGAASAAAEVEAAAPVQVQLRVTPGVEYAKVVLLHGRVVGALLIGDTGLEETLEHLMLNRLDVRRGERGEALDLLDPDVDVEDFFD